MELLFTYNILNWSFSALSGTSAKISLSPQKYHFWHVCELCDPLVHNPVQSSHHLSTAIPSSIFKGLYFLVCLRKQYMMPEIFYWLNFLRLLSQKGQKCIWVKVISASYENIQAQGTWHYIPSEGVHMEQSNFVYFIETATMSFVPIKVLFCNCLLDVTLIINWSRDKENGLPITACHRLFKFALEDYCFFSSSYYSIDIIMVGQTSGGTDKFVMWLVTKTQENSIKVKIQFLCSTLWLLKFFPMGAAWERIRNVADRSKNQIILIHVSQD